jgi:hypothetical protein
VNKILVGLLSCRSTQDRRDLCRATWVPVVQSLGIRVVFMVGGYDDLLEADEMLYLPVHDGYRELPQKTTAFCRWAVDNTDATHLFKADDDTLLHPWRFKEFADSIPPDKEYIGSEWRAKSGYASGGAGYTISRRAAELVAQQKRFKGPEDMITGTVMLKHRITFHRDRRFIPFGNEQRRPLPDNDLISTHKISVELWNDTWGRILEDKPNEL